MDKIKKLVENIQTERFFRGQIKEVAEIKAVEPGYSAEDLAFPDHY